MLSAYKDLEISFQRSWLYVRGGPLSLALKSIFSGLVATGLTLLVIDYMLNSALQVWIYNKIFSETTRAVECLHLDVFKESVHISYPREAMFHLAVLSYSIETNRNEAAVVSRTDECVQWISKDSKRRAHW